MWAKLVNLVTLFWYCDGPEPTTVARQYDCQVRQRKSIAQHFGFLVFTLSNSYPSTSMQKWKIARGGHISKSKQLQRKTRRGPTP